MSIVVQCDRCQQNNSPDPVHGLHTMYQINTNEMYKSQIGYAPQLCDSCAYDFAVWCLAKITR